MKYAEMCFVLKRRATCVCAPLSVEAFEFPAMLIVAFLFCKEAPVGVSQAPQWTILNVHDIPTAVQKESGCIAEPHPM